jgi:type IV pilus assembly protein PilQ
MRSRSLISVWRQVPKLVLATVLAWGVCSASYAQTEPNAIESVENTLENGVTKLRINLRQAPAAIPANFAVNNPPRVAFDFMGTENRAGQNNFDFSQGDVRNMNIVQVSGRSRVVLNLRRTIAHSAAIEGKTLVVTLGAASVATAPTAAAPTFSGAPASAASAPAERAIRDLDFRRGNDGEGRIVVDLSNPQIGVDVRQQGANIVVDFIGAVLPENLRRRTDVSDFGTPVKVARFSQQGANARLIIEPSGLWEHNAYQSENQFVVEVKRIKEDPNKLVQGTRGSYRGDKLSLNFQNVDVRSLLQVIADFTNLNIVTSDSVAGNLTLRLKDVPWDQALDIVLQSKGLDMRKSGNVIMVAPKEELATKEKLELEARKQITDLEPIRNEVVQLNYQKAEAVIKMLTDDKQKILSSRGSAVADVRTNKLFIQDTPGRLDEIRRMIGQLDVQVRQVLIEARIVEADDRFSKNLGAKLGFNDLRSTQYRTVTGTDGVSYNVPVNGAGSRLPGGAYGSLSGNLTGVQDISSQNGSSLGSGTNLVGLGRATAQDNQNFVNLPAGGINGVSAGSFAISLFGSSLTRFLNLEISALEADQRGKVISSPRVMTTDQGKAIIEQGTELPYQTATSSGATAITFRKASLKLEVTPQITPEGNVILQVEVNRDARGQLTPGGFAIDTRAVKTQVLIENGGTIVIGGIYEQFERNVVNKVPFLGDIPILGNLFKNTSRLNDRTELLVFLTPRIVSDLTTAATR